MTLQEGLGEGLGRLQLRRRLRRAEAGDAGRADALAAFLEARPPTLLVTYAEAEQARDLLVDALEES